LAAAGFDVTAIDRDARALARLRTQAERLGLAVVTKELDLESADVDRWDDGAYDLILVTRYLHRPLLPQLVRRLSRRGTLMYETFLEAQAERGRPTNPAFLLKPGELATLVRPLDVLRAREGDVEGAMLSGVVARWPATAS
jgi:hypothetical protein